MRNVKRNAAAVSAGALLAAFGLGGVLSAQAADTATPPPNPVVQHSTASGQVNGTAGPEKAAGPEKEAPQAEDGPNQGPDVNPNEPGHQDADESGEAEAKGSEKSEKSEKETPQAEDGPNQGPDVNPNEPGHQDADESGETK